MSVDPLARERYEALQAKHSNQTQSLLLVLTTDVRVEEGEWGWGYRWRGDGGHGCGRLVFRLFESVLCFLDPSWERVRFEVFAGHEDM